ncbi:cardiolipin synthase [Dongshaea marina]|uniref:cardiolipin synthase n=1 Tax=Dongshaea marina TaxID=2047966 RepID=UPI000D3EB945
MINFNPDILEIISHYLGVISVSIYTLLIIGISIRVIAKRRSVGVSLAWLALIYAIPLAGVILYILFGEVRLGFRRAERAKRIHLPYTHWVGQLELQMPGIRTVSSEFLRPIHDLVWARLTVPMLTGNRLSLLPDPDHILGELVKDINQAQHSCLLEFYIWGDGGRVEEVIGALIAASRRGVDCRLLLDSVGSGTFLKSRHCQMLRRSGVKVIEVLPVGAWRVLFQRQDLRMHRKLVVIDQKIVYTGSMNMVDPRYFKQDAGVGQWIDVMVRIEGPVALMGWLLWVRDWEMETGERLLESFNEHLLPDHEGTSKVQLIPSGPFTGGDCIQQCLLQAIYLARSRILMTTPYFVPDDPLVAALCAAADRGIVVELILPARNNSVMVNYACQAFFSDLLRSGVRIYQFDGGLLHTKSVSIDDTIALLGSVNLDRRSMWLNFELTLFVDDPAFISQVIELQNGYMQRSELLTEERWQHRGLARRGLENLFYLLSPLL